MMGLRIFLAFFFVSPGMGGMGRQAPSVGMMSGLPLEDPDLQPGRIAVRVVDRTLDDRVSGAKVSIRDATSGKVLQTATTGSSGRVSLDASHLEGRSLILVAESGTRTTRSVAFQMPGGKALRFLLALSLPRHGTPARGGRPTQRESLGARPKGASSATSKRESGAERESGPDHQVREEMAPSSTGLWLEFRVRALEAGRLTVTVTYLLDVAKPGDAAGRLLPYPSGFEPMNDKTPAWVVAGDKGLVVQPGLKPGRYSASATGLLRYDTETLLVDMTLSLPVRGYGVVVRRYPEGMPSVVGPVVRRDMGGAFVAFVAEQVTGHRIRFALTGLEVRSRFWGWLALALAIGMVLGAALLVLFRKPGR